MANNIDSLHPEFIVDKDKKTRAVVLPVNEWRQIVEQLEELADIRAYDTAKQDASDAMPFEQAVHEIQEDYDK